VIRRGAIGLGALAAFLVALSASPVTATAQSASPSPSKGPSVTSAQVTGSLVQGGTLTFSVDALMPGGWRGLHLVEASVLVNGSVVEHMVYDIEDDTLSLHDQTINVGTGAVAEGEYLRVSGTDAAVTWHGANLSFRVDAEMVKTITEDPRFRLGVTDDFGSSDQVTLGLVEPESAGTTWGTVATFAVAALFFGVFAGNLFASKRRPPRRPSIYEAVQLRIEHERTTKEKPS
jgi:hypothetical protein